MFHITYHFRFKQYYNWKGDLTSLIPTESLIITKADAGGGGAWSIRCWTMASGPALAAFCSAVVGLPLPTVPPIGVLP